MQYFLLCSSRINDFQTWTPAAVVEVNRDAVTFGCMQPNSVIRESCRRVVTHAYTLIVWVALVCFSTGMALAIQPRYDMGDATYKILFALQVVCVAFFWLRMLAEIVASGLFEGRHSFLRSLWNWLELAVNVFAILQLIPPTFHIRWMRAFAAARPLRFFVFAPWWRHLLVPLARGFPYICDILSVFVLCSFALGLIGVFSVGKELYQRCYITQVRSAGSADVYGGLPLPFLLRNVTNACGAGFGCPNLGPGVTVECLSNPADYRNPFFTYQNVGAAFLKMLKVASLDMWHEDLEEMMNVKGSAAALYLVAVVAVSQFLLVVAMTVVYNAYAHLDSWFMQSAVTAVAAEDRQRKDCGMQCVPPGQHSQQQSLWLRSSHSYGAAYAVDVADSDDGGMSGEHETVVDGGSAPGLTAYSTALGTPMADPRYTRDFFRSVHVNGFWAGLRSLEQTTTPGQGAEPLVRVAATIVDSLPSIVFMMVLSIGNLVLLAIVSVYTAETHARGVRRASSAMAIYFLLPFVLKLIGFGVTRTLMDVWNYADVLGAISGILELAAPHLFDYRMVGSLRVLRYLHAAKHFFAFHRYHHQLWYLLSLVLLGVVIMLLYTLVGMQLFSSAYVASADGIVKNGDFTTLWTGLLACFRAFTGDLWTRYLTMASANTSIATSALFFVSLEAIAMLLFGLEYSIFFRSFRDAARDEDLLSLRDFPPLLLLPQMKEGGASAEMASGRAVDAAHKVRDVDECHLVALRRRQQLRAKTVFWIDSVKLLRVQRDAFFLISPFNPLRRLLLRFFGSLFYFLLSTFCVALGLIALFFERRHLTAQRERVLRAINIVYFVVFCIEMVLKWVAYGLFFPGVTHNNGSDEDNARTMPAYFREPLNWIDFIANGTAVAGIAYAPLRVGRVIRTVRLCTTQERPNKAFLMLIASLRHVAKTVPLILFLYAGFAVAGMQLFAGGLHHCTDPAVKRKVDCHGMYNTTVTTYTSKTLLQQPRVWERAAFHYDAFGPALLSVFTLTTVNHYGRFMDDAMAIVGNDAAMSYNHAGYFVLFFILALLLIRFYALRGVAAVLAAKLRRPTMESVGTALLTLQQTRFVVSRQSIAYMLYINSCLSPLSFRISSWCHRILTAYPVNGSDPLFCCLLNVVLLIACGFLAATHAYQPLWQEQMLLAVECVGVAACGVELLLNVVAYGVAHFLKAPRLIDVVLFGLMMAGVSVATLRFLRVALLVKLIKTSNIAMQLLPVARHVRLLSSALAVYLLALITYAVVGVLVFGDVAPRGPYLTDKRNFSTVSGALLVLFGCSTLDQWHLVMHACFDGAPCRSDPSAICGHTRAAVPFFVSFVVVANVLAVQLVFAAMVNAFTVPLYVDVIQPFLQVRRTWLKYVGAEQPTCDFDTFLRFLPHLPPSLTDGLINEKGSESSMIAFLSSLRLPLDDQLQLRYQDLLRGLAYRKYKSGLMRAGAESYRRAALLSLSAGEYYRQLLRERYCDEITRLAQTKVDAVHLNDIEGSPDGVGEHEAFRTPHEGYTVPRGTLPIPSSNVFLYTFPEEINDKAATSPPPQLR
ncbi:hypothetical protein ABL78_1832 [Leptomonas seymouri]|uniref:Ion transport domain-containing protein n=1 Tax=Leptomonas seymouri TaxID=5684 RepID=A0A0N0P7S1_LEPSE|nr:hypothetical protein ABL78_1832 [Leptomonas seymouri]|eukprot:KPI89096.1 hypothetical protein ABL78_1832 [Leptomonas seymouri]